MPNLILVPTQIERKRLEVGVSLDPSRWTMHTIGFGLVAAGIETAMLLQKHQPTGVVLAGIAGLFEKHQSPTYRLGAACWFGSVMIDGIGVGRGETFIDAVDLGWGSTSGNDDTDGMGCMTPDGSSAPLLSVCAGSADADDAVWRSTRFPDAVGEDMEAYAVAFACRRYGVRCEIVRGFSNLVGQRDQSQWRVNEALASVADVLRQRVDGDDS